MNMRTVSGRPITVGEVTVAPVFGVMESATGVRTRSGAGAAEKTGTVARAGGAAVVGVGRLSLVAVTVTRGGEVTVYPV